MQPECYEQYDLIIIGGGPAGLAAALGAKHAGVSSILVIERDHRLGGILNQCIHNGFGLHTFEEELTGPEYAARFIAQVHEAAISCRTDTMVIGLSKDRVVTTMSKANGIRHLQAKAIVLAMGCRERPRGALNIPGYRPAGIFTAGTAQYYVNIEGRMPGREVVILGSGDIGLIMARRMTLEGARVHCVAELMPYSGGLKRNIVQCLNDYHIPLLLRHTVVDIAGKERVTSVTLAEVDDTRKPIPGTEKVYPCDTLLLSCGLLPENELSEMAGVTLSRVTGGPVVNDSFETACEGIFACGNVLHVHDLVDYVSEEAGKAGSFAAAYIKKKTNQTQVNQTQESVLLIDAKDGVRYTVPQCIRMEQMEECKLRFRVGAVYRNCEVQVLFGEQLVMKRKRLVMSPGEMEELTLKREELQKLVKGTGHLTIRIQTT